MALNYIASLPIASSVSNVGSLTNSAVTPTGADAVFGFSLTFAGTPAAHSGMKWGGSGGDAMTQIGATQAPAGAASIRMSAWRLAAPVIAARSLYGSWASTQSGSAIVGAALSGVDQTTPGANLASGGGTVSNSTGFNATATVTTSAGDLVLAAFFIWDNNGSTPTMTPNGTPTPTDRVSVDGNTTILSIQLTTIVATGASTTVSCAIAPTSSTISGQWGAIAFVVNAASGGASATSPPFPRKPLAARLAPLLRF